MRVQHPQPVETEEEDDDATFLDGLVVKPIPKPPRMSLEERRRLAAVELERMTAVRNLTHGPLKTFDELEALRLAKKKKETPAQTRKRRGRGKSIIYGQS